MTSVRLSQVNFSYDGTAPTLCNFDLTIAPGELVALLGPSGCGKTTVLKLLAGLLTPTSGELHFGSEIVTQQLAEKRNAAMVFQKPLLFPHMTVAANVAFGLQMRKLPRAEITQRVAEALRWVQLSGFENRKPTELSGGQEQRVALARALVTAPRLLLLDEPFSALDESLRAEMRLLVRELQQRLQITTVFVTHDQREALSLADHIALMLNGQLAQAGTPQALLREPASLQVAQFMGWKVLHPNSHEATQDLLRNSLANLPSATSASTSVAIQLAGVEIVAQTSAASSAAVPGLSAKLVSLLDTGSLWYWRVQLADGELWEGQQRARQASAAPALGSFVQLQIPPQNIRYFRDLA